MDEDMNVGELLKETAEENQTRKILEILNECKDLAEAKERVKALLSKALGKQKGRWTCQNRPKLQKVLYTIWQEKGRGRKCQK